MRAAYLSVLLSCLAFAQATPTKLMDTGDATRTGDQSKSVGVTLSGNDRLLKVHCVAGCTSGGGGGTSSNFNAALPAAGTAAGFSDGTNMQAARVGDIDSGAGTEWVLRVNLRLTSNGGSVEAGTSSNPLRVDPTGGTTQPVSLSAAVDVSDRSARLLGHVTVDNASLAVTGTFWPTAAGSPGAQELSDGAAFYTAAKTGQFPSALVGGRLDENVGAWLGSTAPTVGSKTSANSVPVVIASDQAAVATSPPANASTNVAQVNGTSTDTNNGAASAGTIRVTLANNSTGTVALATGSNTIGTVNQGTAAASTAGWPATAGTVAATTAAWTSATTIDTALQLTTTGYGIAAVSLNPSGTITGGSLNFEASDDSGTTWYAVNASRQDSATTELTFALSGSTKKLWQVGVGGFTTVRVRLNPALVGSGTANIRIQASAAAPETQVTVAQATAANLNDTSNVSQFGGNAVVTGTGAGGVGIPRVTISNDSSLAANQSVNVAQVAGSATSTAATGVQKVGIVGSTGTAFDSTAGVLDANIKNVGASAVSTAATGVQKVGVVGNAGGAIDAANNAAAPANVIADGFEAQSSALGTSATAGNVRRGVVGLDGVLYVREGGPLLFSGGLTAIGATLTQIVAAPAASTSLYVTDIFVMSDTATAGSFLLRYGTGSNCGTGTTTLYPNVASLTAGKVVYPANTAFQPPFSLTTPLKVPAANALCIICVATNTCTASIHGYTAP